MYTLEEDEDGRVHARFIAEAPRYAPGMEFGSRSIMQIGGKGRSSLIVVIPCEAVKALKLHKGDRLEVTLGPNLTLIFQKVGKK